jgi:hypothetical protein
MVANNRISTSDSNMFHVQFVDFSSFNKIHDILNDFQLVFLNSNSYFFVNIPTHVDVLFFTITFCCQFARSGVGGHYIYKICKIYNVYVPTCFKRIEERIARPKHGQNFKNINLIMCYNMDVSINLDV